MRMSLSFRDSFFISCLLIYVSLPWSSPTYAADHDNDSELKSCIETAKAGLRDIGNDPSKRFMGKVAEAAARCRGGEKAVKYRNTPWVDWSNYYATADKKSKHEGKKAKTNIGEHLFPDGRGIDGALLDLEYQRIELIKFNLFDQSTYEQFIKTRIIQPKQFGMK